MGLILELESFDPKADFVDETPDATYEEGFVAGEAAARLAIERDQSLLKEALVQALNDSAFGYQEAQAHFLAGLQTYLEALLEQILPAVRAPALHAELIAILNEGAETTAHQPITLRVSADQLGPITDLVATLAISHIEIALDESLSSHAVLVTGENRELALDVDAALAAIARHSAVLFQPIDKVS